MCFSQSDGPVLPQVTVRDPGSPGSSGAKLHRFSTFNSLSNALVADPLRPNFTLGPAYLGQLWGPLPQNG